MKSSLILILSLSLFSACAPSHYSSFGGKQVWPTTKGAIPDSAYVVPVYRGWPERPYRVIGSIPFEKNKSDWSDKDTAQAALTAKRKSGDGLIISSTLEMGLEAVKAMAVDTQVFPQPKMTVLVIKWKSQNEVNAEQKTWEGFQTGFKAAHPDRPETDELLKMSVEYSAYLGLNLDSSASWAKLEEDLNKVVGTSDNAVSNHWLFRGTFHVTADTGSFSETIYGIATMSQTGDSVSITSVSGKADIRFNGLTQDGRLSGAMEISAGPVTCKAKAEGSLVPNKVSLDTRGETANELVRGSFTFLR